MDLPVFMFSSKAYISTGFYVSLYVKLRTSCLAMSEVCMERTAVINLNESTNTKLLETHLWRPFIVRDSCAIECSDNLSRALRRIQVSRRFICVLIIIISIMRRASGSNPQTNLKDFGNRSYGEDTNLMAFADPDLTPDNTQRECLSKPLLCWFTSGICRSILTEI